MWRCQSKKWDLCCSAFQTLYSQFDKSSRFETFEKKRELFLNESTINRTELKLFDFLQNPSNICWTYFYILYIFSFCSKLLPDMVRCIVETTIDPAFPPHSNVRYGENLFERVWKDKKSWVHEAVRYGWYHLFCIHGYFVLQDIWISLSFSLLFFFVF